MTNDDSSRAICIQSSYAVVSKESPCFHFGALDKYMYTTSTHKSLL